MHPAQVKDTLSWFFAEQEKAQQAQYTKDVAFRNETIDLLREEWGTEYRGNVALAKEFLSPAPEGLADKIMGARLADGTLLGDNPDALRFFAGMQRDINPIASIAGGSGTNSVQSLEAEMANLEKMMGDRSSKSEYWRGPMASKHQERYRQLVDTVERVKKRA